MKLFPATDIIGGRVVRLTQGDYGAVRDYAVTPEEASARFREQGASCLHVVDLDGARSGRAENAAAIKQVVGRFGLFVEVGGGIRSEAQVEEYLAGGVSRVILGTVAVRDFDFVRRMAAAHPGRIAVGVDAAGGKVAVAGWREVTDLDASDFCRRVRDAGVDCVIYTDIARDGMMAGANLAVYEELVRIEGLKITASGGISDLAELRTLREMGVDAAILGKALYEGKLSLTDALRAAEGD